MEPLEFCVRCKKEHTVGWQVTRKVMRRAKHIEPYTINDILCNGCAFNLETLDRMRCPTCGTQTTQEQQSYFRSTINFRDSASLIYFNALAIKNINPTDSFQRVRRSQLSRPLMSAVDKICLNCHSFLPLNDKVSLIARDDVRKTSYQTRKSYTLSTPLSQIKSNEYQELEKHLLTEDLQRRQATPGCTFLESWLASEIKKTLPSDIS